MVMLNINIMLNKYQYQNDTRFEISGLKTPVKHILHLFLPPKLRNWHFLCFSKWRMAAILDFQILNYIVCFFFLESLVCILSQKKWFLTLNLMPGKRVTFSPLFWKSNMAAGRHLEGDFKIKKWHQIWNQRYQNTRKTYFTLVYTIKAT